ncbi:hypothetical protein FQN50_003724 [Emmonsiellopsis sp. PD_5]|nr:hypothetical protein FQN50_003724 [Emmonsiellopsis sp. PD_5]
MACTKPDTPKAAKAVVPQSETMQPRNPHTRCAKCGALIPQTKTYCAACEPW